MKTLRHVIALGALLLAAAPGPAVAQEASLVRVDKIRVEPLTQTVPVIGRLVALQSGEVASRIGGAVHRFLAEVGDRVEQGQVIAELDTALLEAQLAVAEGELAEAEAELASSKAARMLSEQEFNRYQGLKDTQAFSKARYEDAQRNVERAKAEIRKSEAQIAGKRASVKLNRLNLEYARIKAPYAGVITRRSVEAGAYVRIGDPVVRMLADQSLEVEADVPSIRAVHLETGARVSFTLDDGSAHSAVVRAILPTENPLTRTRTVRFTPTFEERLGVLADAQSVTVNVPIGVKRQVVTVHKDAIIKRRGKSVVYVVAEGSAQLRPIELGESAGGRIEVVTGLKDGEEVVIRGNERLQPGAKVRIDTGS